MTRPEPRPRTRGPRPEPARATLPAAALLAAALSPAALPAAAQEAGPIRTGEHEGFTRVVLAIDPATEWSLETADGAAELFFPGRRLVFGVAGAFDRIPRTRVTGVATEITPRGTRVAVDVNCDCRISASFVGARYLALDVADRDPAALDAPPEPAEPAPVAASETGAGRPGAGPAAGNPGATHEMDAVATAESILLGQLARAADQGLVRLTPEAQAAATSAEPAPPAGGPDAAPAAPDAANPASTLHAAPDAAHADAHADASPRPRPTDAGAPGPAPASDPTLAALAALAHDQIAATTVYDRDNALLAAGRDAARAPAPAACAPDAALDVGAWTNGLALHAQTPQLMRAVVGEFDRPDPRALGDLARLFIRFGFGAEARALLDDFGADIPDGPLLRDLARTVEGRPAAPDGPLAVDAACPGRHGLWQALGGRAPAFRDAAHFAGLAAAFADLPADMRALLGPTLIARLLDANEIGAARTVELIMTRPGVAATPEMKVAEARLLAAQGLPIEAAAVLRAVAESNAPNAVEALILLTRIALDEDLALPDRILVDLEGAAVQQRGEPAREAELRGLLVEALAARGELAAAVAELRAASADAPDSAPSFARLGAAVLGAADPERVGAGAYAETVLGAADVIPTDPAADGARANIAGRLIGVGLPNAALDLLGPALDHGDAAAPLLAARAHLALGDAGSALAALEGAEGFEALELRAAALARSGAPDAALALLDEAGARAEGQPYAWPSGDWTRVQAGDDDPARLAMAGFMAARSAASAAPGASAPAANPGAAPAAAHTDPTAGSSPAADTPEAAFQTAPPPLETPSLGAARSLLATAAQVGGFLGGLLQDDAAPPAAP